jgi:hypothetical protein
LNFFLLLIILFCFIYHYLSLFIIIFKGISQSIGGTPPRTKNAEWRAAEAKRRINNNVGVIDNHKIGQPAIYNEIPAKNWTGEEENIIISTTPKSQ